MEQLKYKRHLRFLFIGVGLITLLLFVADNLSGWFYSYHPVYRKVDLNDPLQTEARTDIENRLRTYDHVPANATIVWQTVTGSDESGGLNFNLMIYTPSKPPDSVIAGWGKSKDGKVSMVTSLDVVN